MGAVATASGTPAPHASGGCRRAGSPGDFEPGRATLDDRVTALWRRMVESGFADCPVCGEIAAGRPCGDCGSELS